MILAIDPGDVQSAYMLYDEEAKLPVQFGKIEDEELMKLLPDLRSKTKKLAIEMIASYGMAVGQTVFETCVWVGRYIQEWSRLGGEFEFVYRKDVKMHICHTMKAKDSNIRQAILDRYGSSKEVAVGKKANQGPCYGISNDVWAAFGVAITYAER